MAIISEHSYVGNGTQRSFQATEGILSDSHVGVWVNGSRIGTDKYNVLGSVVLFNIAPLEDDTIQLIVSDNGEDLDTPPSVFSDVFGIAPEIQIVADNIELVESIADDMAGVGTVADNIDSVNTVATNINSVINVSDNISDVNTVSDNTTNINTVANDTDEINQLAGRIVDIDNAVDTITNLTASATSVTPQESASATLVGSDIQIKVPRGNTGLDGRDGKTPDVVFSYDTDTGNLEYEIVGYLSISDTPIREA